MSMKIAIAQFNARLGDISWNVDRIVEWAESARQAGASLLVTPELALTGYPPEDLLLRPDFYRACDRGLEELAERLSLPVLVGHPLAENGCRYNAASLVRSGRRELTYRKRCLPNFEVFDEERYFTPGNETVCFELEGVRFGVNICEDVWRQGPAEDARAAGAEALLVLNASPFHHGKLADRLTVLRQRIAATGLPVVYVNLVGGQDELVFDGQSLVLDGQGDVVGRLPQFEEQLAYVSFLGARPVDAPQADELSHEAQLYQALVLGVRDYLGKNGFPGAVIGLSGGIDSALTLCVAVDALGANRVRAVMMPSPYTAPISLEDSRRLIRTLGVRYDEIAIAPAMQVMDQLLSPYFVGLPKDTTEENLQARIRGNVLMALSNKTGALVLTTGNKSEMAVGYCTLYGDMAGGFAVIKDLLKTEVYRLCRWINRDREVIPTRIITRPPSAELRPGQTDQDSLPPYDVLDAIVSAYMEEDLSPREIVARGYGQEEVRRVVRLLRIAEYKRRQAPLGVRLTQRGFGKDWRYPITNRYADEW